MTHPTEHQSRHLLPRLARYGVYTDRRRLTAFSDALSLDTRHGATTGKRNWSESQADFLVAALRLWHHQGVQPAIALELARSSGPTTDPMISQLRVAYHCVATDDDSCPIVPAA